MTEKRFNLVGSYLYDGDECISHFDDPKHRDEIVELLNDFYNENKQLKESNERFSKTVAEQIIMIKEYREENEQLKSENKRLTDKLNKTALELVDECISQGKATEISEMSYIEFLDFRAKNNKPMELRE